MRSSSTRPHLLGAARPTRGIRFLSRRQGEVVQTQAGQHRGTEHDRNLRLDVYWFSPQYSPTAAADPFPFSFKDAALFSVMAVWALVTVSVALALIEAGSSPGTSPASWAT